MNQSIAVHFLRTLIIGLAVANLSAGVAIVVDHPPAHGLFINGETSISGWAANLNHPSATNAARVNVRIPPSHPLRIHATVNLPRPDVAGAVGQRFLMSGWHLSGSSFQPSTLFEINGVGDEGVTFLDVFASTEANVRIDTPAPPETVGRINHPVFMVRGATANYVRNLYRYLLRREAEPTGLDFWARFTVMNTLTGTRNHILNAPEARTVTSDEAYVRFLYWRYLGRVEDVASFHVHLGALRRGTARSIVRDSFINSPEARLLVSDREFVTQAGRQLWLGQPSSQQTEAFVLSLQQGKPRSVLRDEFLSNSRFRLRNLGNAPASTQAAVFDFSGFPAGPTSYLSILPNIPTSNG